MSKQNDDSPEEIAHRIKKELEKDEPLSHDELSDRLDVKWYEVTKGMQHLRTPLRSKKVAIRLDRRYELC